MIREIDGGASSHLSQSSVIAHFGIAQATTIDSITVYWTGGNKQIINNVKPNQFIIITEIPQKKSANWWWYALAGLITMTLGIVFIRRLQKVNS